MNKRNTKHNKSNTRLYNVWCNMKARCYNQNNHSYKDYGERGIVVCDEWCNNFQIFYNWAINNGYKNDLTIERIDNYKNYCPENCTWIAKSQQEKNKRNIIYVNINDKIMTLREICEKLNLLYKAIHLRIKRHHWNVEKALNTPINPKNKECGISICKECGMTFKKVNNNHLYCTKKCRILANKRGDIF